MPARFPSAAVISAADFRHLLGRYGSLIEAISSAKPAKPSQKSLRELDKFRYEEAIAAFQSENPKRSMTHDDVKTLVDWKLRHGKFRPTLMKLVSSNDGATVRDVIQQAMKQYWANRNASEALGAIAKLKGIGPATASLLLSVHDPDHIIFFSDEAFWWLCCDGKKSPIKYNAKEYMELNTAAQSVIGRLQVKATDVEKVAYVLMRQESPNTTSVDGEGVSLSQTNPAATDSPKVLAKRKKGGSISGDVTPEHVRRSKRRKDP
ncbi:hypothetical protein DL765_004242 [Monosporascus sp. GIB2]|nr:hypothetical protein DL765_004242 [Monosporascus sp. GIB2]